MYYTGLVYIDGDTCLCYATGYHGHIKWGYHVILLEPFFTFVYLEILL